MLILDYDSTEIVPGGAGNAAKNVAALGGAPSAIGVAGADETGAAPARGARRRTSTCAAWCSRAATARRPRRASSPAACTRPSSRSCASIAPSAPICPPPTGAAIEAKLVWAAARCDALLVSDYGTGLVTPAARAPRSAAVRGPGPARAGAGRLALRLLRFRGMTACTPNESEVEQLFGITIGDERPRARAGRPRAADDRPGPRRC